MVDISIILFEELQRSNDIAYFDCQFCETCHSGSVRCIIMKFIPYVNNIIY